MEWFPKKVFIQIVKDSYKRQYGIDRNGVYWRLDKLDAKGIGYEVSK